MGHEAICSGAAKAKAQQQLQEYGHDLLWGDTGNSVPWTSSSRGLEILPAPETPVWVDDLQTLSRIWYYPGPSIPIK